MVRIHQCRLCCSVSASCEIQLFNTFFRKNHSNFERFIKNNCIIFWISFLVFLDIYSIKLVMTQFNTGQLSPANHIPMYLIYLGMPLGAFLMTFRVVQHIVFELSEIKSYITKEQS